MPADFIRLAWAAGIILLGWLLYRLVNYVILNRARGKAGQLGLFQYGTPAIVYFTTPDCIPCKTTQRPALMRLQERMGERLQVVEINAYEKPDLAREWGVMSVPTTFIIDSSGKPVRVNHGVTPADKLYEQVRAVQ